MNYLTGYLSPHPFKASKSASMETDAESALDSLDQGNIVRAASEGLKTVGALDLGGSSLEVTFIPGKTNAETVNGIYHSSVRHYFIIADSKAHMTKTSTKLLVLCFSRLSWHARCRICKTALDEEMLSSCIASDI